MVQEALKLWMDIPRADKQKILNNVFCGRCTTSVTICDYSVKFAGNALILKGFCGTCGNNVARVLEGVERKTKRRANAKKTKKSTKNTLPKGTPALRYFIFDVWLYGAYPPTKANRIIRKIQIAETKSLYNFAKVITQAFGFSFDHCFGFYSNFNLYHDSEKAYELFYDLDDIEPPAPHVKSVKRSKIQQVFKNPEDKMLFLFDYGDGWQFTVELVEIKQAEKWDLKPIILKQIGEAPEQYPPCEDDGDSDE